MKSSKVFFVPIFVQYAFSNFAHNFYCYLHFLLVFWGDAKYVSARASNAVKRIV